MDPQIFWRSCRFVWTDKEVVLVLSVFISRIVNCTLYFTFYILKSSKVSITLLSLLLCN